MLNKYLVSQFGHPINQLPQNTQDAIGAYFCLIDGIKHSSLLKDTSQKVGLLNIESSVLTSSIDKTLLNYRDNGYLLLCLNTFSAPFATLHPGIWSVNFQACTTSPFRLIATIVSHIENMKISPMSSPSLYTFQNSDAFTTDPLFSLLYTIEIQLSNELREDDFANQYGYSVAYFSRTFHHLLGVSFREYLCRKRIALAKRLLIEQPNTKIIIIALQCGYKDLSYFNRIFKKKVGMSPGQYKKLALTS